MIPLLDTSVLRGLLKPDEEVVPEIPSAFCAIGARVYGLRDGGEDASFVRWFGPFGAMPIVIIDAYAMSENDLIIDGVSREADETCLS
jgi:hypothetical protein